MEGGGFSIKFVGSLGIRCDKVNKQKSLSYVERPK